MITNKKLLRAQLNVLIENFRQLEEIRAQCKKEIDEFKARLAQIDPNGEIPAPPSGQSPEGNAA